jgi:hypothetical protein
MFERDPRIPVEAAEILGYKVRPLVVLLGDHAEWTRGGLRLLAYG